MTGKEEKDDTETMNGIRNGQLNGTTIPNNQSDTNGFTVQNDRVVQGAHIPQQTLLPASQHTVLPATHHSMHPGPQYQVVSSAQQPGSFFPGVHPNNAVYVSNPHVSNAMVDQNGNMIYGYPASQFVAQPNTDRTVQNNVNPNSAFSPPYIQQQPREIAPRQTVLPSEGVIQVPFENGSQSFETHDNILLARNGGTISDRQMTSSNRNINANTQTQIPTNSINTINSQSQPNPKSYQPSKAVLTEEGEVVRVKKSRPTSDRRRRSTVSGDLRASDEKNHRQSQRRHRSRRSSISMGEDPRTSKSSRSIRPQVEIEERYHASDNLHNLEDLVEVDEDIDRSNRATISLKESNNNHSSRNVRNPPANTEQSRRSSSFRNNRRSSGENVTKDPRYHSEHTNNRTRPMNESFEKTEDDESRRLAKAAERGIRKSGSEKRLPTQRRSSIVCGEKIKPSHHSDPTINKSRSLDRKIDRSNSDKVRKGSDKRGVQRSNSDRNQSCQKAASTSMNERLRRNHHSDPTIDRTLELAQINEEEGRGIQKSDSLRRARRRHSIGSPIGLPSTLNPNLVSNSDLNNQKSSKDDIYLKEHKSHQQRLNNDSNSEPQNQQPNKDVRAQLDSKVISVEVTSEKKPNKKLNTFDKTGTPMDSFTSTVCPFAAVEVADTLTEKKDESSHDNAHIGTDRIVPISNSLTSTTSTLVSPDVFTEKPKDIIGKTIEHKKQIEKERNEPIANSLTSTTSPLVSQGLFTDQPTDIIGKTIEQENQIEKERNEPISNSLTSTISPFSTQQLSNNSPPKKRRENHKTNTQFESTADDTVSNSKTSLTSPLVAEQLNIEGGNHEGINSNSSDNDFLSDVTPTIKNTRNVNVAREFDDQMPDHQENILRMNKQIQNTANQSNTPSVASQNAQQTSDTSNSHNNNHQDNSTQSQRALPPTNGIVSYSQQPVNYPKEIQQSQQNAVTNANSNLPQPIPNYPNADQSINHTPIIQQQNSAIPTIQQQFQNRSAPQQFANNYVNNQQQIYDSPAIIHPTNMSSNHQLPGNQNVNSQYDNNISRNGYSQIQLNENNTSVPMHEPISNPQTANELNRRQMRLQNDNMQYTAVPTNDSRDTYTGVHNRGPEMFPTIQEHEPSNDTENQGESIEAFIANDVVDATGVAVCLGDEEEKIVEERKYITRGFLVAICIVFVVIATVVPVSLFIFKKDPDVEVTIIEVGNSPTDSPTLSPSSQPSYFPTSMKFSEISKEMISAKITDNAELMTPGSPQYRALEWFSQDSVQEDRVKSDQRYLQRFVLAIFHYALSERSIYGEGWNKCSEGKQCVSGENSWLSDTDECEWAMISCDLSKHIIGIHGSEYTKFLFMIPSFKILILTCSRCHLKFVKIICLARYQMKLVF